MSIALKSGFSTAGRVSLANMIPRVPAIAIAFNGRTFERIGEALGEALKDIGILWAAPKKRPSKSRTKINFNAADKQIKHMTNLVRCPACGHFKRSHFMCMNCFAEIRTFLKKLKRDQSPAADIQPQADLDPVDERILYPGKYVNQVQQKLLDKEWIEKREKPLEYSRDHIARRTKKDYLK